MVRPTNLGRPLAIRQGEFGFARSIAEALAATPVDLLDPDEAVVETPMPIEAIAYVQSKVAASGSAGVTVTLDVAPTLGNTLVAVYYKRNNGGSQPATPTGWDRRGTIATNNRDGYAAIFQRVVQSGDPAAWTFTGTASSGGSRVVLFEFSGQLVFDSATGQDSQSGSALSTGTLTPAAAAQLLLIGGFFWHDGVSLSSIAGTFTQEDTGAVGDPAPSPLTVTAYRLVTGPSGSYGFTGTLSGSDDWAGRLAAFTEQVTAAWELAPELVDEDDTTYREVTADDGGYIARAMLADEYRLGSATVKLGYAGAGVKTLELYGATEPDFSDEELIATETYSATGSYTADTVLFTLSGAPLCRFYRLAGDPAVRLYTWSMYEPSEADAGAVQAALDAHLVDTSDAHDGSAVSIVDAGGYFTGADVETALQELGADLATIDPNDTSLNTVASSGSTETLDVSVARTHDVTLTANCTFTFAGAVTAEAWYFTLVRREDGTGGWTSTFPGSVVWPGGVAPTLDTSPGSIEVLTFFTLDGGTTWFGFQAGGGSTVASLDDLTDVNAPIPADGDVLTWDATPGEWVSAAPAPSGATPSDTTAWMPLTTVVGGVPGLVWDADDSLIPTFTPL